MTDLKRLIGQERPIRLICNALIRGRLPQAFLFSGETGVGKGTAAIQTASIANCRDFLTRQRSFEHAGIETEPALTPCGECRACRKIRSGSHPDIHIVRSTGSHIRIDQIRMLGRTLALKPTEAATRFVLIMDAHQMNPEAGNALLKMLEEPPESTVFILTAPQSEDMLPTIVSRCQHIRFSPIARDALESFLTAKKEIAPDNAMIIASLAGGSISRALDMADEDWIRQRDFIIDRIRRLPGQAPVYRHAFAELIAGDKSKLAFVFEIMKNWFRDLAVFAFDPDRIYNRDLYSAIESEWNALPLKLIIEKAEAIAHAERMIKGNANARLAIDALVVKLAAKS